MKTNPFKFGTIVDGEYFTNRVKESAQIKSVLASENHLVILSPRRYVCRTDSKYQIDDPFFVRWIISRREGI